MVTYSGYKSTATIEISKRDLDCILNWGMAAKDEKTQFDEDDESVLNDLLSAFNETGFIELENPEEKQKLEQMADGFRRCECNCTKSSHAYGSQRCLVCKCVCYKPKMAEALS